MTTGKVRPAKKLMEISAKCSKQGLAYGQCVSKGYATMGKDSCGSEFAAFKQCISKEMKGKKW